jgi:hypothetical protein
MATVERRLSALTSTTPVNGFQCSLFPLVLAEANASGMVSIKLTGFQVSESRRNFCLIERFQLTH